MIGSSSLRRAARALVLPLALPLALLAAPLPAQEQDARTEAAPERAPDPFLWTISGHGASGHLFGTVHLPDPRILDLPASVEGAFEGSDAFYAELDVDAEAMQAVARASFLPPGERLDEICGEELWARVEARLAEHRLPAQMFTRFQPWALAATLPMLDSLAELAAKPALDKALYDRAREAGKVVGGIETVEEQISAFEAVDRAGQVRMIAETLDQIEEYEARGEDILETTVQAWLSGELGRLVDLLDEGFGEDDELAATLEESLVWSRNRRMAERIDRTLREHPDRSAFFAIGALHLPDAREPGAGGTDEADGAEAKPKLGVIALLRARGYELERVRAGAKAPASAGR